MKSASALNDLGLQWHRGRAVVWTVASFCVFVAGPALAEVRHNPFLNGPPTNEQTELGLDQSPSEVDPTPISNLSLPSHDARPARLPPVIPTTSSTTSVEPVGNASHEEVESDTDESFNFALPGPIQPPVSQIEPPSSPESKETIEYTAVLDPEIVFTPKFEEASKVIEEASKVTSSSAQHTAGQLQPPLLRSTTAKSTFRQSRQHLDQAINEYSVGAWASAEASAWLALRELAVAADIMQGSVPLAHSAMEDLFFAKVAIGESRDFLGLPAAALDRVRLSHQTKLMNSPIGEPNNANDASDLYLDEARLRLGRLAAHSSDAAEAMDLLAAIYLGRNDARLMPGPVSLCLRRAALQGQPNNGSLATRLGMQLADTGLYDEAYLVLQHAYALAPTKETSDAIESVAGHRGQDSLGFVSTPMEAAERTAAMRPDVIQLSPSEFAAISQPVMQVTAIQNDATASRNPDQSEVSDKSLPTYGTQHEDESEKYSPLKRFTRSLTRFWK